MKNFNKESKKANKNAMMKVVASSGTEEVPAIIENYVRTRVPETIVIADLDDETPAAIKNESKKNIVKQEKSKRQQKKREEKRHKEETAGYSVGESE